VCLHTEIDMPPIQSPPQTPTHSDIHSNRHNHSRSHSHSHGHNHAALPASQTDRETYCALVTDDRVVKIEVPSSPIDTVASTSGSAPASRSA
jgi:hypothetical protein